MNHSLLMNIVLTEILKFIIIGFDRQNVLELNFLINCSQLDS